MSLTYIKSKLLEWIVELPIFYITLLLYDVATSKRIVLQFDNVYVSVGLWLAVSVYRLMFLQIPFAWVTTHYMVSGNGLNASIQTGMVNFTTYTMVVMLSSTFSEVIAGFLEAQRIIITIAGLLATSLSPVLVFFIKLKWEEHKNKQVLSNKD